MSKFVLFVQVVHLIDLSSLTVKKAKQTFWTESFTPLMQIEHSCK